MKALLLLFALLILGTQAYAGDEGGGSQDGGGGTSVRLQDGRVMLVDLYNYNPSLQDPAGNEPLALHFVLRNRNKIYLQNGQPLQYMTISEQPFYRDLVRRIDRLANRSPRMAIAISIALQQMKLLAVEGPVGDSQAPTFQLRDPLHAVSSSRAVAVYHETMHGPLVSLPAFRELGPLSQQALVLHELFRFMDSGGLGTYHSEDDTRIQDLTANAILIPHLALLDKPGRFRSQRMRDYFNSEVYVRYERAKADLCQVLTQQINSMNQELQARHAIAIRDVRLQCASPNISIAFFEKCRSIVRTRDYRLSPSQDREMTDLLRDVTTGFGMDLLQFHFPYTYNLSDGT